MLLELHLKTVSLTDVSIFKRAMDRYQKNMSWKDVGEEAWLKKRILINGAQDGCKNDKDIDGRLKKLDNLFESMLLRKELYSRKQLKGFSFREKNGIGVAIDRNGQLIWLADGAHRLAIAKYLKLEKVPVTVLLVHEEAVTSGRFHQLASKNSL